MRGVPILTFHALDDASDVCALSPASFRVGLERLGARGIEVGDLAVTVAALSAGGAAPSAPTVCLTFDDGYRSVYTQAFPLLRARGVTATVFLAVGRGGTGRDRLPSLQGREMLSWTEIREMAGAGIAFGAHSRTHADLTRLAPEAVEAEMLGSKAVIEDRLGVPVGGFAYPYGRFDARSHALARRHFDFACADTLGLATAGSDAWALPRVETYYLRGRRAIALVASPWLAPYLAVRRMPRAIRRALERVPRGA